MTGSVLKNSYLRSRTGQHKHAKAISCHGNIGRGQSFGLGMLTLHTAYGKWASAWASKSAGHKERPCQGVWAMGAVLEYSSILRLGRQASSRILGGWDSPSSLSRGTCLLLSVLLVLTKLLLRYEV